LDSNGNSATRETPKILALESHFDFFCDGTMKVCGAPGEIRTPDPLVRSLKRCFLRHMTKNEFVCFSGSYLTTAIGILLHLSPLSSTKQHQITQKSRNHMAICVGPIIFEKPGGRDFGCAVGSWPNRRQIVISGAYRGLVEAAAEVYSGTDWRRCTVHFYRSVFSHVPNGKVAEVARMLKAIHAQEDRRAPETKAAEIVGRFKEMKLCTAAELVEQKVGETLTYYA
jgi:hypothetical protein